MADIRLQKMADLLVNYSIEVKPGQWVELRGDVVAIPALRVLYQAVLEAGGNPTLRMTDEYMSHTFLREASDEQLEWISPAMKVIYDQIDASVNMLASRNTRAMTNVDPRRGQKRSAAQRELSETYLRRSAEGSLKWVLAQYPTEADAQEANMSIEEYEDFVYDSMFLDRDDPVAEWLALSTFQQQKIDWLSGKSQVKLSGPNIDLELSVADRIFVNADGRYNMPDGEIFTGPVEDSVNGWVRFSYPSIMSGRAVSGIELKFEDGEVIEASAEQNEGLLLAQLDTDAGSRYLGEFAISTNFGIQQFTGNILFDEKIGGTIHMAIGSSYPETGGKNQSVVHWDMICDMREDSEIHVDDELFYKNGQFVV